MARQGISVATFNLLNLNEPGRRMYRDDDAWTESEVAAKVGWIAGMLHRLDADVVGLQELWHPGPLAQALALAGLDGDYDLLAPADLDGEGIVTAALVRRTFRDGDPDWITAFPPAFHLESEGDDPQTSDIEVNLAAFSRPVMRVRVRPPGADGPIHVFVAHFKSKRPTDLLREDWFQADRDLYNPHKAALGAALSTIRRTAEATALRAILTDLMKGSSEQVVVLGDLNDGQDSNTLAILTEQPRLLSPTSSGGGDTALYSVQSLQEMESLRDVYYTYIHEGQHSSLDHILVSREFYGQYRDRSWTFRGLDVFNDHLAGEEDLGSNDHGIVRARFAAGKG